MKVRIVMIFLVLMLLVSGVSQAQLIAPTPISSNPALPMEILTGLIGKYFAMLQQYQLMVDQGQSIDSSASFRIAASVDISGVDKTGLEPLLTEVSKMAFWVNANVFARYPSDFVVDLSGSFGNIEILTTDTESVVISGDELIFSVLPGYPSLEPFLNELGISGIPFDVPLSINDLEQLIPSLLPSLASFNMQYDGLRVTPRGMAHVIKLIPIDNDMIITLWVLDQTWDLCKVELFDTKDNVVANMTIDQLQLVTSLPDSTFAVDTSAMAELPYDSLIEILDLKLTSVAMSSVPIVADLYPSSSTICQGEKVDVISNALDSESEESELIPSIEYKASNGSWTVLNAKYVGVSPMGSWKAIFAPTLEYPPGSYDLRVSYTDKSGNTSETFEFLNAIKVTAAPPNIVSFTPLLQEKQVSTLASISVTFSQEMNKVSVESSFSLTDSLGVSLPGTFEWSDTSFVFRPQENLKYNNGYTVKIAGTAMGINMESLDADLNGAGEGSPKDDFVWTFTTETLPVLAVQLRPVSKDVIKGSIVVADVMAKDISKLGSFTFDVNFNPTIIKITKVEQAIFANWRPRPKDIGESDAWLPVIIDNDKGKATIAISKTRDVGVTGSGVLATITFEAVSAGESSIDFQNVSLKNILGEDINFVSRDAKLLVLDFGLYDVNKDGVVDILDFIEMRPEGKADVNGDGVVDILDIVASMGSGQNLGLWDTNGDGIVNILDFIKVESDRGANPDINNDGVVDILDIVSMLNGATGAPALNLVNELGASFPNPTNPEAWIPFKLADGSDVVVRIYNTRGQLVRTLDLGYRLPGKYTTEATAAHWDGKDENGQRISSGVYFYNIKAGNFTATRKLIVLQ
jgi:outer membrane lipoprotein-sorting protein/Ca2+-binding EF-hand superfamily protein